MGKARNEKSALNRLSNRFASEVMKKSKRVKSEIMKKSKRVTSASSKSSVLERAKIVEKSRAIPPAFLTGGRSFCMIKKNTFPAGASRINRQKIGAA